MAFNLDFSKSREALGRITQFLQYDAMQRRAMERQQKQAMLEGALSSQLASQKFGQDVSLERFKADLDMEKEQFRSGMAQDEELNKKVLGVLADPTFDGVVGFLNLARAGKLGKDPENGPYGPQIKYGKALMENAEKDIGEAIHRAEVGDVSGNYLSGIVKYYGTKALDLGKEIGVAHRANMQYQVDTERNRIAASAESRNNANFYPKQLEEEVKGIDAAIAYISKNRIDMPDQQKGMMYMLEGDAGLSVPATLPADIHGMVLEGLNEIRQKVNKEKRLLTEAESKFVKEAFNAWKLRGTRDKNAQVSPYDPSKYNPDASPNALGGLTDPNTGARATDKSAYDTDAKRAKVAVLKKKIMAQLGVTDSSVDEDYYTGLAIEYYNSMFLAQGEEPIPYPEGYVPQGADGNGLIKTKK